MLAMKVLTVIFLFGCACFGAKVEVHRATRQLVADSSATASAFVNGGTALPNGAAAPDLFQGAVAELGGTPHLNGPCFMEQLVAIEEKLRTNVTLCEQEIQAWVGVQGQIQNSIGTDYCNEFNSSGVNGVCCYVQATGRNFGLCSSMHAVNATVQITPQTTACAPGGPFEVSPGALQPIPLGTVSTRSVIHIDLFAEICENLDVLNLCYVYVSQNQSPHTQV